MHTKNLTRISCSALFWWNCHRREYRSQQHPCNKAVCAHSHLPAIQALEAKDEVGCMVAPAAKDFELKRTPTSPSWLLRCWLETPL